MQRGIAASCTLLSRRLPRRSTVPPCRPCSSACYHARVCGLQRQLGARRVRLAQPPRPAASAGRAAAATAGTAYAPVCTASDNLGLGEVRTCGHQLSIGVPLFLQRGPHLCAPHLCALCVLSLLQAPPISLGLIHRCVLDLEEPDVGRHMAEVLAAARAEVGHGRRRRGHEKLNMAAWGQAVCFVPQACCPPLKANVCISR